MKKAIIFLFLAGAIVFIAGSCCNKEESRPYLVVLSMDGFRWDYPDSIPTPNLDVIAQSGVKAKSLQPAFPSKTFPNHYTMATGLYPNSHGIVLNSFWDPDSNIYYAIRMNEAVGNGYFYGGEPIWVTAEKQGVKSASYFWVGSEAEINGYRPSIWKKYDHDFPYEQRLDSVLAWLQLPEDQRPHLIMWYMDEPDHSGHYYGPFAEGTNEVIMYQDSLMGVYLDKIAGLPIADEINLIITSDHGMQASDPERTEYLEDYIKKSWLTELQGYNPNYNILAADGCLDSLYQALLTAEHFKVWKAGEVPERLNYGTHPRCMDLIVCADSAWRIKIKRDGRRGSLGDHGYDNRNTDMHAIFYASGPAFKKGHFHPTFNNVDLYPLMAYVLGLEPAEVDGRFENVKGMLTEE
ncbi:MAG: alkaline phosphatase family protein [Bacteroidales bacterium]|nr:alkaline phosphatase family protein [Bacteroidales bacterium]